ncbi:hypothetical protein OQJ26_08510 [Legionella sp. PATHC038]|uniref:hypothetical protein n=1 Tax=Legionella sheltonii TaxID=2992041 RepID=UPI002244801E|nr:hypothetical protein [Legionella sp. PATHC038]MCW8398831.1 hypothetical protein [Legionella sp. PATHC038]
MFGLFSKGKKKTSAQFDLEAQPLVTRENEEKDKKKEIQTPMEPKPNYPEIESFRKAGCYYEILLSDLESRHKNINQCINFIKREAKLYSVDSNPKFDRMKLTTTTLLSGTCSIGFSYLLYDLITRIIKKSQLEERWENVVFSDTDGSSVTCYELNGSIDNTYVVCQSLDVNPTECIQLKDEYCSEALMVYIAPESVGTMFVAFILLYLLYLLLCQLLKSDRQSIYDNYPIYQLMSDQNLLQLKNFTDKIHIFITDKMTKKEVITRLEQPVAADVALIRYCLEIKKHAHYLFYICNNLLKINGIEIPYEVAELIFLRATEDIMIADTEKAKKNKEAFEVGTGKGKGNKIKNNSCETDPELSKYKQGIKPKMDIFARFFNRAEVIPDVHSQNHNVIESNILQVLR